MKQNKDDCNKCELLSFVTGTFDNKHCDGASDGFETNARQLPYKRNISSVKKREKMKIAYQ